MKVDFFKNRTQESRYDMIGANTVPQLNVSSGS